MSHDKLKVLFHLNETEKWQAALGNITNLLNDAGHENVDVVVVANSFAVYGYTDPEKIAIIEEQSKAGVHFLACRNSLRSMCQEGIACVREDLLPSFISIVPAGITEIVKRQRDGYAYVKP
jgi:intracellular sulfur oxidation DsrE/DsrF family protein